VEYGINPSNKRGAISSRELRDWAGCLEIP